VAGVLEIRKGTEQIVRSPLLRLAAAAALTLATAAGLPAARAAAPPGIWQILRSVSPDPTKVDDSIFTGVSMASASDGWAVGSFSNPQAVDEPLAEHWGGHSWRITATPPLPKTGANGVFNGVDEAGPANVWAVGSFTPAAGGTRTLIEHFTGKSWAVVHSPNPFTGPGAQDELNAVGGTSASDLWAAGFDFEGNIAQGLFAHFNGTTWKAAPPLAAAGIPDFEAVSAVSPSDVWAVGTSLSVEDSTLAAHWDGHTWQVVTTPCLNGTTIVLQEDACRQSQNELTGVTAVATNNVWASGFETESSGFHVPYVLHWNGTTWSLTMTPNPGQGQGLAGGSLFGITAVSASDVWAVGHSQDNAGTITTLTERFNGSTWSAIPSPNPGLLGNDTLFGVASAGGGQVFAIGSDEQSGQCCARTLALRTTSG
jgi:hypothetical protein